MNGNGLKQRDKHLVHEQLLRVRIRFHAYYLWRNTVVYKFEIMNRFSLGIARLRIWWPSKGNPVEWSLLSGFEYDDMEWKVISINVTSLYILSLLNSHFFLNCSLNSGKLSPRGRSWHSFTILGESPRALLYGGLSSEGDVLGRFVQQIQ